MSSPSAHGPSRGGHLLDAVLDVLATQGVAGLSVRSVAAAAGVSPAQVQYYFRTRAELIEAAFTRASDQFLAILAADDGGPDEDAADSAGGASWARLHRIIRQWLPLTEDSARRARVWLAYAGVAAVDERLAAASASLDDDLRAWLAAELTALAQAGQVRSGLDPAALAAQLLALIDGVTLQCLTLPRERCQALADQGLGTWCAAVAVADAGADAGDGAGRQIR